MTTVTADIVSTTDALVGIPSPTLQVIGAGFGRTGTLSLRDALIRLGHAPCDHAIHSNAHPERYALWLEAARRKRAGEPIDWRPLFAGYRATTDWPGAYFWRELVAAHPDAKVILTVRDPERWYDSLHATAYAKLQQRKQTGKGRILHGLLAWLDPRAGHRFRTNDETLWQGTFGGRFAERQHALRVFAEHNRAVQATVPADRLLVFDVKQGWEPLCRFLDVPVPAGEPFPHAHSAADAGQRQLRHYLALLRSVWPALGAMVAGAAIVVGVAVSRDRRRPDVSASLARPLSRR
jgi:hypothetical protein